MDSLNSYHPKNTTSSATSVSSAFANLIEARTVLEKKHFVSTGAITYIEGDIAEVEISEWDVFHLGDPLKVIIYSPIGILNFESTVVAKDLGSVIILVPPVIQSKFLDKRQYPRVDVRHIGNLHRIHQSAASKSSREFDSPIPIETTDISLGGVGFIVPMDAQEFKTYARIEGELQIGFKFGALLEIIRKSPVEGGMFYGAKMLEVSQEQEFSLRAFILRTQVSNYFKQKSTNNS